MTDKLSKKQAGKLGGLKTAIYQKQKYTTNIRKYNNDPKICPECSLPIPYEKRNNKFCSHSCAATCTNKSRVLEHNPTWHKPIITCPVCNTKHKQRKYCSRACQQRHTEQQFNEGLLTTRRALKKQLIITHGERCVSCGLSQWKDTPLSLELDHKDGDASNNLPSNLQLLCPNCHSITPTWKGRNKGSGRKSRKLPIN